LFPERTAVTLHFQEGFIAEFTGENFAGIFKAGW
jgi:hypothetical protein